MNIDLDELRRKTAEIKVKQELLDAKAGYCLVERAKVPAPFADEALKRTAAEANPFLLRFAQIIVDTGDWPKIDDKSKVIEWRDTFAAIVPCKSYAVESDARRYWITLGVIAGESTGDPLYWAEIISEILKDHRIPRTLCDPLPEEFEFDYDTELEKAKEAHKLWVQELRKHRSID